MVGTDERVLGGRNHGYVPRGRIECYARGYQCSICEPHFSSWRLDFNLRNLKVSQDAFVAAAKALKRQITPEMLRKFERWKNEYGVSILA